MQRVIAAWCPRDVSGVVHHDVGQFSRLERADAVSHSDRFRSSNGRELERSARPESHRVEPGVARDTRRSRRSTQDVRDIARVRCVAPERDTAAALDHLRMATHPAHALPQPQVRPWAVRDRGTAREHEVDLGVVEPHSMREQEMLAEHTESIEMHDRTATVPGEILLRIRRCR